jgi:AAA15 family ATPase/GTPase
MLKSFEISNFRCFSTIKGKGFSQVNLIGGKNNSGKTALLEALLLMAEPSRSSITKLLAFRRVNEKTIQAMPSKAWDNFFYQQNKTANISFKLFSELGEMGRVEIKCDEEIDDFVNLIYGGKDREDAHEEVVEFATSLTNAQSSKSVLRITAYSEDKEVSKNFFVSRACHQLEGIDKEDTIRGNYASQRKDETR